MNCEMDFSFGDTQYVECNYYYDASLYCKMWISGSPNRVIRKGEPNVLIFSCAKCNISLFSKKTPSTGQMCVFKSLAYGPNDDVVDQYSGAPSVSVSLGKIHSIRRSC